MASRQLQLHCAAPTCNAVMPHTQDAPNHVLHGLVTLFTAGFWLPIWILVSIGGGGLAVCSKCGNRRPPSGAATVNAPSQPKEVSVKTKLIIFGACIVLAVAGISYGLYLDG